MKSILILGLLFLSPNFSQAEVTGGRKPKVKIETFDFTSRGKVESFHYTSPTDGVSRTIVYYFPKSITNVKLGGAPQKTLVFLHGGGSSTASDAGATSTAKIYIQDFIQYAEQSKVLLIFPTSSFGWNAHTSYFMRNFLPFIRSQLAVDSDKVVLAGHSMGGMGITREYPWMTDLFTGFLGLSAGTQPHMLVEDALLPYLNGTPYTHINGDADHFSEFKPRMLAFKQALDAVVAKFQHLSSFQLIFRPGGHNYDLSQTIAEIERLFSLPKNRYPKFFQINFGIIHFPGDPANLAATPKIDAVVDEGFWIKIPNLSLSEPQAGMYLTGEVRDQTITLTSKSNTLLPKSMTLNLSNALVDLKKPIQVIYDGKIVFSGVPSTALTIQL